MFFTIRLPGRSARLLRAPAEGIATHLRQAPLWLVISLAALLTSNASAQSASKASAPGQNPRTFNEVLAIEPPGSGTPAPDTPPEGTELSEDAFTKLLSEKGLLGSARPMVELAQQVRDKASSLAGDLVMSAMTFLGVPYRRGGNSSESGFDCSGFTRHVFENSLGLVLPRRAAEQARSPDLLPIQKDELKPGDLVFFNTLRHTFSHVGIYIGDNKFIHSPRAGGKVRVEDMRMAYWQQRFDGARRVPKLQAGQTSAGAQPATGAKN